MLVETLVGSPVTYFLAGIAALSSGLASFGHRAWRMGPMALLGVVIYAASTAIVTSYHYVQPDYQVTTWTTSLLAVGLLYLAILTFRGVRFETIAILAIWIVAAFALAMTAETDLSRKAFWLFQFAGIGTLAFVCFLTLAKDDLIGHLIWGVLFIAEWISAFQIVDCQFLHGMAGKPIVDGSACAAVYGWSLAPFIPTALPTLFLAWFLFRWFNPRRG